MTGLTRVLLVLAAHLRHATSNDDPRDHEDHPWPEAAIGEDPRDGEASVGCLEPILPDILDGQVGQADGNG